METTQNQRLPAAAAMPTTGEYSEAGGGETTAAVTFASPALFDRPLFSLLAFTWRQWPGLRC